MPATVGGAINGQPTYEAAGEALRRRGSPKSRQPRESRQPQSAASNVASSRPAAPTSTPPPAPVVWPGRDGPARRQRVTQCCPSATSLPNGWRVQVKSIRPKCCPARFSNSLVPLSLSKREGPRNRSPPEPVHKVVTPKPCWLVKGVRSEAFPFTGSMLKEWTCPKTKEARLGTPWHAEWHPRRCQAVRCDDATL